MITKHETNQEAGICAECPLRHCCGGWCAEEEKMEIEYNMVEESTLEEFADKNGLIMEVHEQPTGVTKYKFYAHFKRAELIEGGFLAGNHGNGHTPEEAIEQYAIGISEGMLSVFDDGYKRRNIKVPRLISKK